MVSSGFFLMPQQRPPVLNFHPSLLISLKLQKPLKWIIIFYLSSTGRLFSVPTEVMLGVGEKGSSFLQSGIEAGHSNFFFPDGSVESEQLMNTYSPLRCREKPFLLLYAYTRWGEAVLYNHLHGFGEIQPPVWSLSRFRGQQSSVASPMAIAIKQVSTVFSRVTRKYLLGPLDHCKETYYQIFAPGLEERPS